MRVVGYYNSFVRQDVLESLFVTPLTHINYAFLLPKEDGSVYFYDEENVKYVVDFAHKHGKKVFVSVGGYCDQSVILNNVFEKISMGTKTIARFINSVIATALWYGFDGVDLDWEYPTEEYIDAFDIMTASFSNLLHKVGKEFSIAIHRAVPGDIKERRIVAITDNVIASVDWINIMTYDGTEEFNHSSYERCIKCYEYWHGKRKVPRDKVLIGTAFYAQPSQMPYSDLVAKSSRNAFRNSCENGTYNGIYTVREKTFFGRLNCGGLIIWAINYDSTDKYSLLKAIHTAMSGYMIENN